MRLRHTSGAFLLHGFCRRTFDLAGPFRAMGGVAYSTWKTISVRSSLFLPPVWRS